MIEIKNYKIEIRESIPSEIECILSQQLTHQYIEYTTKQKYLDPFHFKRVEEISFITCLSLSHFNSAVYFLPKLFLNLKVFLSPTNLDVAKFSSTNLSVRISVAHDFFFMATNGNWLLADCFDGL
jgi:hypothetical protein